MTTDLISMVGQVGFPIVVCFWFMFRNEKVISKNTEAINKLTLHLEGKKK